MFKWPALGLAVVFVAGSLGLAPLSTASAWAAEPTSHWDAGDMVCADVMFVGVRGSGEESGYGAPIEHIRDGVQNGYGIYPGVGDSRTVREVYLDYPAAAVEVIGDDLLRNLQNAVWGIPTDQWTWAYLQSIDIGAQNLRNFLIEEGARCPAEKWVLAGYSQGSLVIHMVLDDFADYARFGGVFLLADPGRKAGDPVLEMGTAPADGYGVGTYLWPDLELPSELSGLIFSECDAYDAVCDIGNLIQSVVALERTVSEGAEDGMAVHTTYQQAMLQLDARHIVTQLMGMPVPLQDSYEILVEPGEEYLGSVSAKPVRDDVSLTWRIKPGSTVPPGTVTDDGILVATNGSYIVQVPEGKYDVQLEVLGEFEEHVRDVTLTIRAGEAWQPVTFGDPQLEMCMRAKFQDMAHMRDTYPWLYQDFIEPPLDRPLLPEHLRELNGLTCQWVESLEGLQWATEITSLGLWDLQTDDLGPVSTLTKLGYVDIYGDLLDDISPLANSTEVWSLDLGGPVTDLSPLAGMTDMTSLRLEGLDITTLSPLAGMHQMDTLSVSGSPRLTDISAVASMPDLRAVSIWENPLLTSVSALAGLGGLEYVDLHNNDLTSLAGLQDKPELTYLRASWNRIQSIAPLQNATALRQVHLDGNLIESVAPLSGKLSLEHLEIHGNEISDLTPIAGLPLLSTLEASFNRITDLSMFAGNATVRTVSASVQSIQRETAAVGDSVTLPVFRTQTGAVLQPWVDEFTSGATATLTGDPATGMTLTWTGTGSSVIRWEDPAGYFYGQYVVVDVTADEEPEPAATVPTAPAKPSLRVDGQDVTVNWSAPDDGGSAITGYTVTLTPASGDPLTLDAAADATSVTFTDVPAGSWTANVTAHNAVGASEASPSSDEVTVAEPAPEPPTTIPPTEPPTTIPPTEPPTEPPTTGTPTPGTPETTTPPPAQKKVTLSTPVWSKSSQTYGSSKVASVRTTVTGLTSGTVTFRRGGSSIGTAKIVNGRATLKLKRTTKVGSYAVSAHVSQTATTLAASSARSKTFKVVKAKLKAAPKVTAKAFSKGKRPKVTVNVGRLSTGAYATGKVKVYVGKKVVKTVRVKASRKGRITVTLPKKYSSSVKVKAVYVGSSTVRASSSKVVTVKVKAKARSRR